MSFKSISPSEFHENVFDLIKKDWFLMTAEADGVVNTMTVAWATLGILWQKPVVIVAVRPERYTHEIASKAEGFSLTVFHNTPENRKMLGVCGTKSGRDLDKVKEFNFTVEHDGSIPYFAEGRLNLICKKLCVSQLAEGDFPTDELSKFYGGTNNHNGEGGGYHHLYIAELTNILVEE